ncbi:MAG: hypothetical protein IPL99_04205 [Candidatus Competibacteraceae bacterium]|nr:hypothetical protein [Candidatus Competibacteraceae bacterium]
MTAQARTEAQLQVTATGAVSFELYGQNTVAGADAATISVNVSSSGNLTELAAAINDKTGKTGITAKLHDAKDAITLTNSDGYDIALRGKTGSSATVDVAAIDETGASGTVTTIASGVADEANVAGRVLFESGKSFSVEDTGTGLGSSGSKLSSVGKVDISTQSGSNDAISVLDNALSFIDDLRADLGAVQNRFTSTINNLQTTSENISDARSRIQDTDFAKETGNLSRGQILQQAGIAMLAQANQSQQSVLKLLG